MEAHGMSTAAEYVYCDGRNTFPHVSNPTNHIGLSQQQQQHGFHYHQNPRTSIGSSAGLKLNLESDPLPDCFNSLLENAGHSPMLGSPDLNLLKLGSPELEKLIMSEQNHVNAGTGTYSNSGSGVHHPITTQRQTQNGNPLSNTKLQHPTTSNMFAHELQFITETNQALESLLTGQGIGRSGTQRTEATRNRIEPHLNEGLQQVPESHDTDHVLTSIMGSSGMFDDLQAYGNHSLQQQQQRLSSFSSSNLFDDCQGDGEVYKSGHGVLKSEEGFKPSMAENQSVPALRQRQHGTLVNNSFDPTAEFVESIQQSGASSPVINGNKPSYACLPVPPIDLEVQEIVKRERKKLKNRVAASKCRKKKLEREAQLEVRVQQLKERNIELNAVASALRMQVNDMKRKVLEHINSGCQLHASHQY